MAAPYKASMCLATQAGFVLPGAASNDFLVYTGNSNQATLFGVSNVGTFMRVDGSGNVAFAGNVGFSNQMALAGIQLTQRTSTTTNNVTSAVTAVDGFSKSGGTVLISANSSSNYIGFLRSNSEQMRLNSNGSLGIGTSNPQHILHVASAGDNITASIAAGNSTSSNFVVMYSGRTGDADQAIAYGSNTNLRFGTSTTIAGTGWVERMRITSNGNLGIGTSTPSFVLDVTGTGRFTGAVGTGALTVSSGDITTSNGGIVLSNIVNIYPVGSNLNIKHNSVGFSSYAILQDSAGKTGFAGGALWGLNAGNIGIGLSNPMGTLHLANPTFNSNQIVFEAGNSIDGSLPGISAINFNGYYNANRIRINNGKNLWRMYVNQNNTTDSWGLETWNGTTATNVLFADNTGNVGIGTTNPTTNLHVISTNPIIQVGTSGGTAGSLYFGNSAHGLTRDATNNILIYTSGTGTGQSGINFSTQGVGNIRMRINDNGYVGIGTSSPSYPLHVTSSVNWPLSGTGYFFQVNTSTLNTIGGSGSAPVSIYSSASILTLGAFFAPSDKRIKNILSSNNGSLDIIDKIDVFKYTHIDKLLHGENEKYGFIAQEVAKVYPAAVSVRKGFLPNVFKTADVSGSTINLALHGFAIGDRIRVFDKENKSNELVVLTTAEDSFTTDVCLEDGPIFVYGKEVDDFHSINSDAILGLAVGTIKEMRQEMLSLKKRLEDLEAMFKTHL